MEVLHPHCAGLMFTRRRWWPAFVTGRRQGDNRGQDLQDDHRGTAGACPTGLRPKGCTHVAMEATGVYWKPVWHILRRRVRAGAGQRGPRQERAGTQDRRQRRDLARRSAGPWPDPGQLRARRADRRRCAICCAPASSSCASAAAICSASRRRWRTPTSSSIRSSPTSLGISGRAMLEALIAGETDPAALAALAHRRIKATADEAARRPCAGA